MMKTFTLSILLAGAGILSLPASALELTVSPGSLSTQLTDEVLTQTSLTLRGSMDVRDFNTLQDRMPALRELDLADVEIEYYQPPSGRKIGFGGAEYPAHELPQGALAGMKLTSLQLPSTLISIGPWALSGTTIATLDIPEGVTTIGAGALQDCPELTAITLPASVQSLGEYALARCPKLATADLSALTLSALPAALLLDDAALTAVKLPSSLRSIGDKALAGTPALTAIELPASLTSVGTHAFAGSGLQSIVLPKSVTTVGDYAFSLCPALKEAVLQNGTATLGQGIFFYCPEFVSFTAKGIDTYPPYLFSGDTLLSLPESLDGIERIEAYALKDNAATQLRLGSSLIYLGDGAMEGMTALTDIDAMDLDDRIPALGEDVFAGIEQSKVKLLVAEGRGDVWNAADQWKDFNVEAFVGLDRNEMPVDTGVRAWFEGTQLRLSAPQAITTAEVYDIAGRRVISAAPAAPTLSLDASGLADRIYIIRATLADGSVATAKITR